MPIVCSVIYIDLEPLDMRVRVDMFISPLAPNCPKNSGTGPGPLQSGTGVCGKDKFHSFDQHRIHIIALWRCFICNGNGSRSREDLN